MARGKLSVIDCTCSLLSKPGSNLQHLSLSLSFILTFHHCHNWNPLLQPLPTSCNFRILLGGVEEQQSGWKEKRGPSPTWPLIFPFCLWTLLSLSLKVHNWWQLSEHIMPLPTFRTIAHDVSFSHAHPSISQLAKSYEAFTTLLILSFGNLSSKPLNWAEFLSFELPMQTSSLGFHCIKL